MTHIPLYVFDILLAILFWILEITWSMLLITKHEYQRKQRQKAVFKEGGFLFVLSGLFLFILICPLIRKRGKKPLIQLLPLPLPLLPLPLPLRDIN